MTDVVPPATFRRALRDCGLAPLTQLVLYKLADHMHADGEGWVPSGLLAAECVLAERTLRDHLAAAESGGWLDRRPGRGRAASAYRLRVPETGAHMPLRVAPSRRAEWRGDAGQSGGTAGWDRTTGAAHEVKTDEERTARARELPADAARASAREVEPRPHVDPAVAAEWRAQPWAQQAAVSYPQPVDNLGASHAG